jgi:hypothetical protein
VGLAIVLVLSLSGMVSASPPSPDMALDPASPTSADDGTLEVGAEFPSADAPPWGASADDRPVHRDSAWNFYNKMRAAGYTGSQSFIWGNNAAWETDWKRAALGGSENSWVDNVDIMFVHSHGNVGSIWIPWGHTDTSVVPNDCAWSWGDKDVEWIGVKTCLTLADRQGWGTCMNGVHLIAGFTTLSASREFGGVWADQLLGWKVNIWPFGDIWLRSPKTVTQAWFTACDSQTAGATARVIAEHPDHFNDKVWNRGGPARGDDVDNWYHWIDHSCYKAAPNAVDVSLLAAVPAYQVLPRTVDKSFAESLAATLNMTGTLALSPDGQEYAVTNTEGGMTRTLSIQTATGGYSYQDLSQLWVPPQPGQPLTLPPPEEAARLANAYFLDKAQSLPGGQNFTYQNPHVENDTTAGSGKPGTAAADSAPLQETGVDVMVAYSRTLATTVTTASGDAVTVNTSVAGPGGTAKLYLGGQSTTPIGLSGGSRDVRAANQVTLKDVNSTWETFVADPALSVLEITIEYDEMVRHPISDTFAYFEQPLNVSQQELVPTWVYDVDFISDGQVVANGLVYVPASPQYYPPEVTIDAPLPNATIMAGRQIALNGTVANGNGPFTYEWATSSQGVLGTSEDMTSLLLSTAKPGDPPVPVTLSLKVTDANGLSRTAEITVNVVGQPTWLPLVIRNQ